MNQSLSSLDRFLLRYRSAQLEQYFSMLLLSGIPLPTLIPANQNMSRESIITWYNRPFKNHNSFNYNHVLDILKFHALNERWRYCEALFKRKVYNSFITCHSYLEAAGHRVTLRNETFSTFHTLFSHGKYDSIRCTLATNEVNNNFSKFVSSFFNISFLVNLVKQLQYF